MPTLSAVIKWATNIDELRRELKAGTGDLVVLQSAAERTTRVLGGEGMIRAAHNAAVAIEKLGGTTALTAKEQERVHGQMGRVIEKMEALNRAAAAAGQPLQTIPEAFRRIHTETARLPDQLSRVDRVMGALKSTFAQFTAAALAASAIQKATAAVGEFVATGAKLPGMEASFNRLATSVGQDSQSMLASMQTATRGLVSNFDLMASANKAMLLGLPVSTKEMSELAKTATVLGKAMGQDATKSLDDLITALGRSSPLILDNLGLTVKVGEANEKYAAKLGKTVEQLTDAEKKTAFYQAAMEAARAKTTELGEQSRTLGEIAQSVWVSIGNEVSSTTATINQGVGAQISSLQNLIRTSLEYLNLRRRHDAAAAESTEQEAQWTEGLKVSRLELVATAFGLGSYVNSLEAHAQAAKLSADAQQAFNAALAAAKKAAPSLPTQPGIAPVGGSRELAQFEAIAAAVDAVTAAQKREIQALKEQGATTDFISAKLGIHTDVLEMLERRQQAATKATSAHEAAERKAAEEYKRSVAALDKYAKLLDTTDSLLTKASRSAIDAKGSQAALHNEFDRGVFILNRQIASLKDRAALLGIYTSQRTQTPQIFGGGSPTDLIGQMGASTLAWTQAFVTAGQTAGDGFLSSLRATILGKGGADFGQMVAGSILSAFQGGGNVAQSAGAAIGGHVFSGLAKSLTTKVGDTAAKVTGWLGGALNAALPILGSLLGSFGGKLVEKILSAFDRNKGRDVVVKWVTDTFGGFEGFQQKLAEVFDPATADKYWRALTQGVGRNNPEQARRVIAEIEAEMRKVAARTAEFNTKLQTSLQRIKELGGGVPDMLEPLLRQLREAGTLTEENLALLDELASGGTIDWRKLEEAANRYGISQDKLGQEFNEAKLHERWQQVIDDLDLFSRAGADVNGLLTDMADEISDLVQDSIKFGTEIPENMRPWIEKLIESGELVDENGEKITDIGKLKFGETLQTSLQKLIDEVRRLIDAIRGVPEAVDEIPSEVTVDVNLRYRQSGDLGDRLDPDRQDDLHFAARGGIVRRHGIQHLGAGGRVRAWGTDTVPAMLTPGEGVLSLHGMEMLGALNRGLDFSSSMAFAGDGAALNATVILDIDRREFARATVPVIPGEARRLGVRVRN